MINFFINNQNREISNNQNIEQSKQHRQLWAYGEYYSDPVNSWLSWNGSWRSAWAYQSIWMQWDSTQVFDLASFSCVDSWNSTTSVLISNSQYSISSVCRSFDYYVDPTSTAVIELGTLQYPFKSLGFVFVELLNFHANTERTINVYLKENTKNYIDLSFNYIINMTMVTISSYSITSRTPSKAIIVAGEVNDPTQGNITAYYSNTTVFNILLNTKLNKDKQLFSSLLLSSTELSYLSRQTQVVMVHKSNFTIDNIVLNSTFNDINSKYVFIFLIYLQNRNFRMTNVDTQTSGAIIYTSDPLNVFLENINIDYSRNNCGFFIGMFWNYPEAYTDSTINSTNMRFYYSAGDTLVSESVWFPFLLNAPGTVTLTKIYFDIYGTVDNLDPSLAYSVMQSWFNTISDTHFVNFKDIYMTMSIPNYQGIKINMIGVDLSPDPYHMQNISISKWK